MTNTKMNVKVNFANIVSEIENRDIKLVFLEGRPGFFIEDQDKNMYGMEIDCSTYLDRLIKNGEIINFNLVDSTHIEEWEKEVWNAKEVNSFMNRQGLTA